MTKPATKIQAGFVLFISQHQPVSYKDIREKYNSGTECSGELKALRDKGLIRKTGTNRNARYYAVTNS